jgi:hypothetical protein
MPRAPRGSKKTPAYRQAGGGGTLSNVSDVILYGQNENMQKYNRFFGNTNPDDLLFVFFQDYTERPNEYSVPRPVTAIDNENVFQVYTCNKMLNDNYTHDMLCVSWGNRDQKLKSRGVNPETQLPFFYVESYPINADGSPTKYWGTMFMNQSQKTYFGTRKKSKGTRTSDIRYLLNLH